MITFSPEFISGALSGFAQTIIGHPIDTLKVWIQSNHKIDVSKRELFINQSKKYPKINLIINKLYNFPHRSLFRGILFPLTTNSIIGSFLFYNYKSIQDIQKNNTEQSFYVNFTSGVASGMLVSPFIYYITSFKLFKQVNQPITINKLISKNGLITTIMREGLAFGIYFSSYDYCMEVIGLNSFLSGGISGMLNWSITYPIDTIRNRQIVHSCSLFDAIQKGNLYNGYSITLSRALLVNGVGFYVYELAKSHFQNNEMICKEHK